MFQAVGAAYLAQLNQYLKGTGRDGLGLPPGWLCALRSWNDEPPPECVEELKKFGDRPPPLRWLDIWPPLDRAADDQRPPRLASWNLVRHVRPKEGPEAKDITVVLVAAELLPVTGSRPVGLDLGVRIPMSVIGHPDGPYSIEIRSMTAELPYGPYRSFTEVLLALRTADTDAQASGFDILRLLEQAFGLVGDGTISAAISRDQQLTQDSLQYDDLHIRMDGNGPDANFEAFELDGKGLSRFERGPENLPYSFMADLNFDPVKRELFAGTSSKHLLVTNMTAQGEARLFRQDPPSWRDIAALGAVPGHYKWSRRRPTRSETELDRFRTTVWISNHEPAVLESDNFKVRNCPVYVPGDPDNTDAKTVSLPADKFLPVRYNDYSALSAYNNSMEFYALLEGFGFDLANFSVAVKRELQVHYRSGISPGPGKDGQTINARVTIKPPPEEDNDREGLAIFADEEPTVEMHLALGNLSHRGRWDGALCDPAWAQPLGIATSERWMLHEFGHVVLAARLGKLEFDFAHSAGDGIAAVWSDPFSRLAHPGDGVAETFRGITFPWVFTTRRHDRFVGLGWAWGGALNRSLIDAPASLRDSLKGYISEQILSSTLFRLYRVLGGDTVKADGTPNYAVRERASFVTLYLLLEAIRSLAQPPSVAQMLECAMEAADADLVNPLYIVSRFDLPATGTNADAWTGGRAVKAVRWAFEAQGMFAPFRGSNHNAPGLPLPVDIYIRDNRPLEERADGGTAHYSPGAYTPVSLDWDGERLWQAAAAGLSVDQATATVSVRVRNRGVHRASAIQLHGWVGVASGNPADNDWDLSDSIDWLLQLPVVNAADVDPDDEEVVQMAYDPAEVPFGNDQFLVVMVEANCPEDPANSDPATGYSTAIADMPPRVPRFVADIVANDNNMALWMGI
ncbi:hypothetical protein [Hoeflea sp. TYP-13]|uniref:hypothetical protein n=1 Tax=Hoeflea sp. TYP-13 TaxID=3230023 RepID=UPI0034C5E4E9